MAKLLLTERFSAVSLRLFRRIVPRFAAFEQIYQKSGIHRLYESYMTLMFFAYLIAFVFAFLVSAVIHYAFFKLAPPQFIEAVLTSSFITSLLVPVVFLVYPLFRGNQRKNEIDANLVYTAGYMGVLAAGGISTERIFDRVTEVELHPALRDLAKRFIANLRMFGLDVVSSLKDLVVRSPSETFSKLLLGIVNTVQTSGDLKSLLAFETKRLLGVKREQLKKTLNTLIALAEIYVTAIVLAPITFIVMLTILSVMGTVAFGMSPAMQLNLLVFLGLPMLSIGFILILNSVLPEEG
jgi:flagellar protein FlaJ